MNRCDCCNEPLTAEATAQGWPIADGDAYICPECYGDEAFCPAGHVLSATVDTRDCQQCAEARK